MVIADAGMVILAEHLGHGRILSSDERDFRTYRWKRHPPFHNLLMSDPEA
jgi:predicted nucleic acid-binding protein